MASLSSFFLPLSNLLTISFIYGIAQDSITTGSNVRITQIMRCSLYICNATYTEDLILNIRWHGNKYLSTYMNTKNNSTLVLKH